MNSGRVNTVMLDALEDYLMLSVLVEFSANDILKCFFFFFFLPQKIGFDSSSNLSLMETLHEMSDLVFWEK